MSLARTAFIPLAFVALLALGTMPFARAQEKAQHPIIALVKAELKEPTKPFTITVQIDVKDGSGPKFEAAFAKVVGPTRQEKGCLLYQLNRDLQKGNRFLIYERWRDLAALEAHIASDYIQTLLSQSKELLADPPMVKVLVPVGE